MCIVIFNMTAQPKIKACFRRLYLIALADGAIVETEETYHLIKKVRDADIWDIH